MITTNHDHEGTYAEVNASCQCQTCSLYASAHEALVSLDRAQAMLPRWTLGKPGPLPRVVLMHLALDDARQAVTYALQARDRDGVDKTNA